MLRISKKADYAVFLLGTIARQGAFPGGNAADSVVSAHEIAKLAGLNKSVVANLLKEYARSGLLTSVRGLRGGYRLARHPADVSLAEILEVVEGKFVLVDCVAAGDPVDDAPAESAPAEGALAEGALAEGAPAEGAPAGVAQASDDPATAAEPPLLPQAPKSSSKTGDGHGCSLIAFCPSKQPMRVVHQRISKLFADIHLDELCALTPVCSPNE